MYSMVVLFLCAVDNHYKLIFIESLEVQIGQVWKSEIHKSVVQHEIIKH